MGTSTLNLGRTGIQDHMVQYSPFYCAVFNCVAAPLNAFNKTIQESLRPFCEDDHKPLADLIHEGRNLFLSLGRQSKVALEAWRVSASPSSDYPCGYAGEEMQMRTRETLEDIGQRRGLDFWCRFDILGVGVLQRLRRTRDALRASRGGGVNTDRLRGHGVGDGSLVAPGLPNADVGRGGTGRTGGGALGKGGKGKGGRGKAGGGGGKGESPSGAPDGGRGGRRGPWGATGTAYTGASSSSPTAPTAPWSR